MTFKVLFLEDQEDLVAGLPILLEERGFEMVGTMSISEALDLLSQESFDAVLLDIMMPPESDMDAEQLGYGRETGVEVVRRMKSIKPHISIVAFTVLTDPEIRERIRKAGVCEIINKPTEPESIGDILSRVITSRT